MAVSIVTALPSGASTVGVGAGDIRRNKYQIQQGLAGTTGFPDRTTSLKEGWGRAYVGAQSASSYTDLGITHNAGKLYFASNTSRLLLYFHRYSDTPSLATYAATALVGTGRFIEKSQSSGRLIAYSLSTEVRYTATGDQTITFPTPFAEPPFVVLCSEQTQVGAVVKSVTATQLFVSGYTISDTASSAYTLRWWASGYTEGLGL